MVGQLGKNIQKIDSPLIRNRCSQYDTSFSESWISKRLMCPLEKVSMPNMADQ